MAWKRINEKYSGVNTLMDGFSRLLLSAVFLSDKDTFTYKPQYLYQGISSKW